MVTFSCSNKRGEEEVVWSATERLWEGKMPSCTFPWNLPVMSSSLMTSQRVLVATGTEGELPVIST